MSLNPILYFISELINLNYTFNTLFKISLEDITMGASSQSHDGIHLKVLPRLSGVLFRHLSYCHRKVFHKDGYDEINELSNYNSVILSLVSTS